MFLGACGEKKRDKVKRRLMIGPGGEISQSGTKGDFIGMERKGQDKDGEKVLQGTACKGGSFSICRKRVCGRGRKSSTRRTKR
jgi:hypothetical protein